MQVFEIMQSPGDEPVTVFADTLEESCSIYRVWLEAHRSDRAARPITIYSFGATALERRPVLAIAARQNTAGIGYWCRTAERWVIGAPDDAALGDLVEPEPRVGYYRVEVEPDEGEDAMVFAKSFEHATTLYCAYHLDWWGPLPSRFSFRKMSRWDLHGDLVTLRDGMQAEITGVAHRDEEGVWRILPPDWNPRSGR